MRNFYILCVSLVFLAGSLFGQAPTVQSSAVTISNISQTHFDISWTRGDGAACVAFAYQGMLGTPTPLDNETYGADVSFGSGDETTNGSGWFCIYNGTGNTVTLTDLTPHTHYLIYVFEYNGVSGSETHLTTTSVNFAYSYTLPTLFNVSGGGGYCVGENPTGVDVELSDSETGVSYQLKKGGAVEGSAVNGDGSTLTWTDLYAGVYTIEATNSAGVATMTGSATIIENALPAVSFTGLNAGYCVDATAATLVPTPATGAVFTGAGMSGNDFTPAVAGQGTHTITLTYTDVNGCTNTAEHDAVVYSLPVVSFTGLNAAYCIDADTAVLVANPGGTFTGTGITGNEFIPEDAGAGTFTITLTYTDGNSCTNISTQDVTVNDFPVAAFTGLNAAYCVNSDTAVLVANPGGTFSGTGITGNEFIPEDAGAGTFTITLIYTDGNGCTDTTTQDVTVNTLTPVSFTGLNSGYCVDADTAVLVPDTTGTIFSGDGMVGDNFIPAVAGVGSHIITLSFTDGNGCVNTFEDTTEVFTLPVISLNDTVSTCSAAYTLDAGAGFAEYNWSNGDSVQTILADTSGLYVVTVTDVNGCVNSAYTDLSIELVVLTVQDTVDFCEGATVVLTATGSTGLIIWEGTDTTNTYSVTPATAQYYYVELISGLCSVEDSVYVMPHAFPTVTLPATVTACGSTVLNPAGGAGTYNWTGGIHTPTLTVTTSGTYAVTVTNSTGCSATGSSIITILPAPNVDLGADITITLNQTIILGTSAGYTTYLWSTGAATNSIAVTGSDLGVGLHELWLNAELANGCEDRDTIAITVTWASAIAETNSGNISVYPNPARETVYVMTENGIAAEEISVYNLLGQKVINVKQTEKVDVSALPSGMYTMIINITKGASVQRNIIVE